jgi:hypothetical protein
VLIHTDIWVAALVRRVELGGAFATVVRKGDARGGAVLVKGLDRRTGEATVFAQAFGGGGEQVWMRPVPAGDEAAIDAHIARAARVDPDLWVVEIEAADAAGFLTEPVEKS